MPFVRERILPGRRIRFRTNSNTSDRMDDPFRDGGWLQDGKYCWQVIEKLHTFSKITFQMGQTARHSCNSLKLN